MNNQSDHTQEAHTLESYLGDISKTTKNFWTFRHFLSLFACLTGQQVSTGLTGPTSMQVLNNKIINMIVYAFNIIILAFEIFVMK
jgi:hypothetical protein